MQPPSPHKHSRVLFQTCGGKVSSSQCWQGLDTQTWQAHVGKPGPDHGWPTRETLLSQKRAWSFTNLTAKCAPGREAEHPLQLPDPAARAHPTAWLQATSNSGTGAPAPHPEFPTNTVGSRPPPSSC